MRSRNASSRRTRRRNRESRVGFSHYRSRGGIAKETPCRLERPDGEKQLVNNWIQVTPERGPRRPQCRRFPATSLPVLLVLGLALLWPPTPADGQIITFDPISPQSVGVGSNLDLTLSVTPLPVDGVIFGHGGAAPANSFPANASLDSTSGRFDWTPNTNQLGANSITVWAFEPLHLANSNYTTFIVTVTNAVTPVSAVVIDPILPQAISEGATLSFTNHAHATDNPANALVFSLLNAPSGASMTNDTPTSGVFTWRPTAAQAANPSYTIRELVTEPSASASSFQDFQVTVTRTNNCSQLDAFLAAVQQGGYFPLSNCTTIVLTNTVTISNSVILDAGTNTVTITGNNLFRLFTVLPGVTNFTLSGLTISGGQDANGGGLYINQGATVVLTNCTFTGNRAAGASGVAGAVGPSGGVSGGNGGDGTGGGSALGGAIYNLGSLTALSCQFLTNSGAGGNGGAGGGGGNGSGTLSRGGNGGRGGDGAPSDGGAIYSAGNLSLSNCTFLGNSVAGGAGGTGGTNGTGRFAGSPGMGGVGGEGSGAAVYSANYAVILNCTFSGNVGQGGHSAPGGTDSNGYGVSGAPGANSLGGGLYSVNTGFLTNCTFCNNQVTGGNGGGGGSGTSTLASGGNGGNGGNGLGGGLYNAGSIAVVNCTFSGCGGVGGTNGLAGGGRFAGNNGSMGLGAGGDIAQGSGSLVLANSILATNAAGGNAYDTSASRITDGGYNISSDSTPILSGTSLNNTDPQLSATLANNGGPTLTLAFLANTSPVIDKIPPSASPATDQRGIPRPQPQGGLSDIGAYELVTLPAILTQPQSQAIGIGSNATFTVVAVGNSLSYQWRFNITNLIAGAVIASYTIASAAGTNAGNYDVVIGNSSGSVTSAVASLTVLGPPAITMQPSNQTAVVAGNASFSVSASGPSPLNYQWRFNGVNISGATLSAYVLNNVQPTVAGTYDVIVADTYGSVTSLTAVLSVFINGRITQGANGLPGVMVAVGTNVSLTDASGYYTNRNLLGGANLMVTPSLRGYAFAPAAQPLPQTLNPDGLNFLAFPSLTLTFGPDGSAQLAFAAAFTCGVETSTNLKTWQAVFTTNNISTNTLLLQFTDTNAPNFSLRFYRLGATYAGLPVLTDWTATSSAISLAGAAAPIVDYHIDVSTDLKHWTGISTNSLPTNSLPLPFRYTKTSNAPVRFYRLFQTPGF
jgi:hypothetical protein